MPVECQSSRASVVVVAAAAVEQSRCSDGAGQEPVAAAAAATVVVRGPPGARRRARRSPPARRRLCRPGRGLYPGRVRRRRRWRSGVRHVPVVVLGGPRGVSVVGQLAQVPVDAVEGEALARVVAPAAKHHSIHVVRTTGRLLQQNAVLQELNHLPYTITRAHTRTFNGLSPGLPRCARTRKVKPIWMLLYSVSELK